MLRIFLILSVYPVFTSFFLTALEPKSVNGGVSNSLIHICFLKPILTFFVTFCKIPLLCPTKVDQISIAIVKSKKLEKLQLFFLRLRSWIWKQPHWIRRTLLYTVTKPFFCSRHYEQNHRVLSKKYRGFLSSNSQI